MLIEYLLIYKYLISFIFKLLKNIFVKSKYLTKSFLNTFLILNEIFETFEIEEKNFFNPDLGETMYITKNSTFY